MKRAAMLLVVLLALSGCSDVMPKITPPPVVSTGPLPTADLWTVVFDRRGSCLDATLAVVRGQDSGTVVKQDSNCNLWDRQGGYTFQKLSPLLPMTVRASAPGYLDEEQTATPRIDGTTMMLFTLVPR